MEKNCKWHFKPEGGSEIGPNDPLHIIQVSQVANLPILVHKS